MTRSATPVNVRAALVQAALEIFAEKGFESASTREIADRANTNISSIRYYFGDKAGLYRAAYTEPLSGADLTPPPDLFETHSLQQALEILYKAFLEPLKHGETLRLVMKLHFREMIEPTGAWEQEIDAEIRPHHHMLVHALSRRFGLEKPDLDVHRLAFSLVGIAVHYMIGQDLVDAFCPAVLKSRRAVDVLVQRLAGYGLGMVHAEYLRRGLPVPGDLLASMSAQGGAQ